MLSGVRPPPKPKTISSRKDGPCYCEKCKTAAGGFTLQSRKTRLDHAKRYPPNSSVKVYTGSKRSRSPAIDPAERSKRRREEPEPNVAAAPVLFDAPSEDVNLDYSLDNEDDLLPISGPDSGSEDEEPPRASSPRPTESQVPQPLAMAEPPAVSRNAASYSSRIPALSESSAVRQAYLVALIGNSFKGFTESAAEWNLKQLLTLAKQTGQVLPTHKKPATTLKTVRKRLRVDPDEYIDVRPICSVCFKHYTLEDISRLDSPACTQKSTANPRKSCTGTVYNLETSMKNGQPITKRVPIKTLPYSSPIPVLRRLFAQPGFAALIRDSRQDADRPPLASHEKMNDVYDGIAWRKHEVGLQRRFVNGEVIDSELSPGSRKKIVSFRYGLQFSINLDWFEGKTGSNYSIGVMYMCILNLARSIRYKSRYIIPIVVIPGPREPSLEQLNNVIYSFSRDFVALQRGIDMFVHGEPALASVPGVISFNASDTPASRKLAGQASHAHNPCPCPICTMPLKELNLLETWDEQPAHEIKDKGSLLSAAFLSAAAPTKRAKDLIFAEFGVRQTDLNLIPGWDAWIKSVIDLMHNGFLRIEGNEFDEVLVKGHMLSKKQWKLFEDVVNSISFPSHTGRLPTTMADNHKLKKADELRTWSLVAPAVLYAVWKNDEDSLPTVAEPIPPRTQDIPAWAKNRNPAALYDMILLLSCALRTLALRSISLDEVNAACEELRMYCRLRLLYGIPLVISHHLAARHYPIFYKYYGPGYAQWLFAFETFNGEMERFNTNGHGGGEMETTLLRNWIRRQLIFELLSSLPPESSKEERALILELMHPKDRVRGSYMCEDASFESTDGYDLSTIPSKQSHLVKLRAFEQDGIYVLLLNFARTLWPELRLISDMDFQSQGQIFRSDDVARAHGFIVHQGFRYGSLNNNRSQSDRHILVTRDDVRVPAEIVHIFRIQCAGKTSTCLVIRRFHQDDEIPSMPWGLRAADLGYYTFYLNRFEPLEVILPSGIACPIALMPLTMNTIPHPLAVGISWDRSESPPDELFDEE